VTGTIEETERLYVAGRSKRFPSGIWKTSVRKLDYLNRANVLQDLQATPGNHLEALKGDRKGFGTGSDQADALKY
jgi:proteic killer suppression protein